MFKIRLDKIKKLSDSTSEFTFTRIDGGRLEFKPGEFFRFIFTDVEGAYERSYSLCNIGEKVIDGIISTSHLLLMISKVDGGRATEQLFSAKPGLTAEVSGPFGRLVLPESLPSRVILAATSVGIAPYLPMLSQLEEPLNRGGIQISFLYGTRDMSEYLYASVLEYFADKYPNFDLRVCFSRQKVHPESPHGFSGHLQTQFESLKPFSKADLVMLCGNPAMVDDCFSILKAEGLGVRQIKREKYVFASRSAKKGSKNSLTEQKKRLLAEKMKKYL